MQEQNQAVCVFTKDLNIKFTNAKILSTQYLKKYKQYTPRFVILFGGHLQALRHYIDLFADAFFKCETQNDCYKAESQEQLDIFLSELLKFLQSLKRILWYELEYNGKMMYKFKKPKSQPHQQKIFEGDLDIRHYHQLEECLHQSYYERNKEKAIQKSIEYYYTHHEHIKQKRREEYAQKKQQQQEVQ